MYFEKYNEQIQHLYHYTTKENAEKIIREKRVHTGNDRFCFFTRTPEDSRMLFFELMQKSINYIDADLHVTKRIPQNPDDYVILKIEAHNDSSFYRFVVHADDFNPYEYSLLHKGELHFEYAQVLPMVPALATETKSECKKPVCHAPKWKRAVAACFAVAIIGLNSVTAFAASSPVGSWTDSENYDISWYDPFNTQTSIYTLTSAEQLAGLAVLIDDGVTFDGKVIALGADMDLTAHNWNTISADKFKGTIEGLHKVVTLFSSTTPFVDENVKASDLEGVCYINNGSTGGNQETPPVTNPQTEATEEQTSDTTASSEEEHANETVPADENVAKTRDENGAALWTALLTLSGVGAFVISHNRKLK